MKKWAKKIITILGIIALFWTILTFIAQIEGPEKTAVFGSPNAEKTALVVYDPDLFYNLDEQVCHSFAKGLESNGWLIKVATVAAAKQMDIQSFDLYVFCANTYNWAPDWPITGFIRNLDLNGKQVAAITLGSGSTKRAKRIFESNIKDRGANLLGSKTYWLMRPNDESRIDESNISVAVEMAYDFGRETAQQMESVYNHLKSSD